MRGGERRRGGGITVVLIEGVNKRVEREKEGNTSTKEFLLPEASTLKK